MIRNARSTAPSSTARLASSAPERSAGSPSMTSDPKWTPMTTPSELNACAKLSLKWLRFGGPRSAASGFAATCSAVNPAARTNKAARIGAKATEIGADDHQQAAARHRRQRPEDHVDRADTARQPGGRKGQQAVGEKEDDLGEQRFSVVEAERRPQRDDQRVIVRRNEAPGEEERGHRREGEERASPVSVGRRHCRPLRAPQRNVATDPAGRATE